MTAQTGYGSYHPGFAIDDGKKGEQRKPIRPEKFQFLEKGQNHNLG